MGRFDPSKYIKISTTKNKTGKKLLIYLDDIILITTKGTRIDFHLPGLIRRNRDLILEEIRRLLVTRAKIQRRFEGI